MDEFANFNEFIWSFVGGGPKQNAWKSMKDVPSQTPESDAMSKELKRRGFRFVGSTICYAFMQAMGITIIWSIAFVTPSYSQGNPVDSRQGDRPWSVGGTEAKGHTARLGICRSRSGTKCRRSPRRSLLMTRSGWSSFGSTD